MKLNPNLNKKGIEMDILDELKKYADLRLEEAKLKLSGSLSRITGAMFFILIAFGVIQLFAIMLCIVMMQSLDNALGKPWGAVIICGILIFTFALLIIFRKKLFRHTFDSLFSSAFGEATDDIARQREMLDFKIELSKEKLTGKYDSIVNNVAGSVAFLSTLSAIFRKKKGSDKIK